MTPLEIPTSPQAQTFRVPIAGATYTVTLRYNKWVPAWVVDLADQLGNAIATGIPMVPGADLLGQLGYLALGFALYAQTDHDPDAPPTYANLGSTGHLFAVLP